MRGDLAFIAAALTGMGLGELIWLALTGSLHVDVPLRYAAGLVALIVLSGVLLLPYARDVLRRR